MNFEVRSTDEIYQRIIEEKNNNQHIKDLQPDIDDQQTLLNDLKKKTQVAVFRLFSYTIAYILHLFEENLGKFYEEVNNIAEQNIIGTKNYFEQMSFYYQDNDIIQFNETESKLQYPVEDDEKKIITSANIEEAGGKAILKVKKEDTKLNDDELSRFQSYIDEIKPLGVKIDVRSDDPDLLTLNLKIIYTGERSKDQIQNDVEDTITNFIENLEFNGIIRQMNLIDEIQKIESVKDVHFYESEALNQSNQVTNNFTYEYKTYAGWAKINSDTPLSDTIEYEKE